MVRSWEVPRLAQLFRVRQQRVMAILALKEREEAAAAAGIQLNDKLAEAMEDVQASWEVLGSGERHHVTLPSFPNFKAGVEGCSWGCLLLPGRGSSGMAGPWSAGMQSQLCVTPAGPG